MGRKAHITIVCCAITRSAALSVLPVSRRSFAYGLGLTTAPGVAAAAARAADDVLSELSARLASDAPKQFAFGSVPPGPDTLRFPGWLEGAWAVRSRLVATAAPLGARFLPADLHAMRLSGAIDDPRGLRYAARFVRFADGGVRSDRKFNLASVQDAAAGYRRVEEVAYDARGRLQVVYSEFGRNGTYAGPSRAEVYFTARRQSRADDDAARFAFSESTRTVFTRRFSSVAADGGRITVADTETVTAFERQADGTLVARQRILRFLTPNPNSAEGVLWQEAQGRAVAILDYELALMPVPASVSDAARRFTSGPS
jgi:hypothetical protein